MWLIIGLFLTSVNILAYRELDIDCRLVMLSQQARHQMAQPGVGSMRCAYFERIEALFKRIVRWLTHA